MHVREGAGAGAAAAADGEAQRGRVGVLVEDDRQAQPLRQGVPQREAVPFGESGHPARDARRVVQGAGHGHADAQDGRPVQLAYRAGGRFEDPLGPGAQVEGPAAGCRGRPGEVEEHGVALVAVQVQPHGVGGPRHEAQHRARLAPGGGAAAGVVGEAVRAQPGGDLADGLGGEAGAFGELQSADAVGAGGAEQSEHESGVVAA